VEVYQRFSDEPLTECGVCGGPLRKVFHPAGILFKGSGFYKTDSRSSRTAASGDGAKKSETKVDASKTSGSTSDSKKPSTAGSAGSTSKEKTA
jgi:predicted nucleic acid-binding Zn ribbon protein